MGGSLHGAYLNQGRTGAVAGAADSGVNLSRSASFELGGLEVRPATLEVAADDVVAVVEPRVMQVLVTLAERRGEVVPRDDLLARCWQGRFVGDAAVSRCMQILRRVARALGGFSIRTVSKVGYRLDEAPRATPAPLPVLAVLAFEHPPGDAELQTFASGLSEGVLEVMSGSGGLRTIGRSSSFQIRGLDRGAGRVGRMLGATHVLDGSVRRQGPKVRVWAELVECRAETCVWSEGFDCAPEDPFTVQHPIARAVASALATPLETSGRARAFDFQAYDWLLKGRDLITSDPDAALALLTSAIERSPGLAPAWAARAYCRGQLGRYDAPDGFTAEGLEAARRDAEAALKLDPRSAVALAALNLLEPYAAYRKRERWLIRACDAAPNDGPALASLAGFYSSVGFFEAAVAPARRAVDCDPLWAGAHGWCGSCLEQVGRWSEALEAFAEARFRWPENDDFRVLPLSMAAIRRDWVVFDELMAGADRTRTHVKEAVFLEQVLRTPTSEIRDRLRASLERRVSATGTAPLGMLTTAYLAGLADEVFEAVGRASYESLFTPFGRNPGGWYSASILFACEDGIWRDPRFPDLTAKLGLNAYWAATSRWPDVVGRLGDGFRSRVRASVAGGPEGGRRRPDAR